MIALVAAITLGVSGCSFDSGSASNGDEGGASQAGVVAPIIVSLDSIDGTTVEVPVDNVVVLESGSEKVTVWTASVADPKVAQFVPGRDDGSATFNPGIQPLAAGETTVTVTNSDTGNESTFELDVTP